MSDKGLEYYIIDLETNGLKTAWHEIIEISIIRYSNRNQFTRMIKAEYPERSNQKSLDVTNRTILDLRKGDSKSEIFEQCRDFLLKDGKTPEHRCCVAHNISFDKRFIHNFFSDFQEKFPVNFWLDTVKLSKKWALKKGVEPENYKLASVLKFANISGIKEAHTAQSDTRNTYFLFKKALEEGVDHLPLIERHHHIIK